MKRGIGWPIGKLIFGLPLLMIGAAIMLGLTASQAEAIDRVNSWPVPGWEGGPSQFIVTNFRTDAVEIRQSTDYYIPFRATQYPYGAKGKQHANVSLIISQEGDEGYGSHLRAGLLATRNEIRWFVLAGDAPGNSIGLQCVRGSMVWDGTIGEETAYKGCLGNNKDIVKMYTWHGVRFIKDWRAWNVYIIDGKQNSYLVATLKADSSPVTQIGTDYGITNDSVRGGFMQGIPYYKNADGRMRKWPGSVKSSPEKDMVNYAYHSSPGDSRQCPRSNGIKKYSNAWYTGRPRALEILRCEYDPLF